MINSRKRISISPNARSFSKKLASSTLTREPPSHEKKSGSGALAHLPPSAGKVRYEVVGEPCIQKIGEGVPARYKVAEPEAQQTTKAVPVQPEAVEFAVQQKTRKWAASRDVPVQMAARKGIAYSKKQDA